MTLMSLQEEKESPREPIGQHVDLGLQASTAMGNEHLLSQPPSLGYFVIAAQAD